MLMHCKFSTKEEHRPEGSRIALITFRNRFNKLVEEQNYFCKLLFKYLFLKVACVSFISFFSIYHTENSCFIVSSWGRKSFFLVPVQLDRSSLNVLLLLQKSSFSKRRGVYKLLYADIFRVCVISGQPVSFLRERNLNLALNIFIFNRIKIQWRCF